jgi:hypothetical protein
MASERQIAANRQNAKYSTGPRTEYGKRRSRQNAIRHGLTAETVISILEDPVAYKALQRAIHADYSPRSNFELQLVGRLVSLLWRLRRATAIESGMLGMEVARRQKEITRGKIIERESLSQFYQLLPTLAPKLKIEYGTQNNEQTSREELPDDLSFRHQGSRFKIAESFMRLCRRNGNVLERLGRYEERLWRQTLQTILLLNSLHVSDRTYSDLEQFRKRHRHIRWPPFGPPK